MQVLCSLARSLSDVWFVFLGGLLIPIVFAPNLTRKTVSWKDSRVTFLTLPGCGGFESFVAIGWHLAKWHTILRRIPHVSLNRSRGRSMSWPGSRVPHSAAVDSTEGRSSDVDADSGLTVLSHQNTRPSLASIAFTNPTNGPSPAASSHDRREKAEFT